MLDNFTSAYPKFKKFTENPIFNELYNFISSPDSIGKMIISNNSNKPALCGIIDDIENIYGDKLDLKNDNTARQMIGSIIKVILSEFGFQPNIQKKITNAKYFRSASQYIQLGNASKDIVVEFIIKEKNRDKILESKRVKIESIKVKGGSINE